MKKQAFYKFIAFIVILKSINGLWGGVEPEIRNTLTGSTNIVTSATLLAYDPVFFNSGGTTTGVSPSGYHLANIHNTLQLEVNQAMVKDCPISSWSVKVLFSIARKDKNGSVLYTIVDTLRIDYDATSGVKYRDKHIHDYDSSYWTQVTITSVTVTPAVSSILNFVTLASTINITRYKDINLSTVPTFNSATISTTENTIEFSWDAVDNAEEYDLEIQYVDDYAGDGSSLATSAIAYTFRHNATRITTQGTSYKITPAFERGYILARIRAIGKLGSDFKQRAEGKWSNDAYGAFVNSFTLDEDAVRLHETGTAGAGEIDEYEAGFNWQFSASYAEEGKKKEVIEYMDGTFRHRQSVTRNNSDNMAIVGESIYDQLGRPTISILPVPAFDNLLGFHSDFNLNSAGDPYSNSDFDLSSSCSRTVDSLSYLSGAGRYYSAGNPRNADINHQYIPNAFGYPFAVTELMPDNTGRVRRQGGVGINHQLGSGHETKYFYSTPFQEEIDRLFGNSAGYANHYEKNMVIDPNGGVSVSYLDLQGRVVATALAGEAPANLSQISTYDSARTLTTSLLSGTDTMISPNAITISKTFAVAVSSLHKFNYALEIPRFTPTGSSFCYDCVYNLKISLKDDCGNELFDGNPNIAGNQPIMRVLGKPLSQYDTICEEGGLNYGFTEDDSLDNSQIEITLGVGTYTIYKTLEVNEDAADFYAAHFLKTADGIKTKADFEAEYLSKIDYTQCDATCTQCLDRIGSKADYLSAEIGKILADSATPADIDTSIINNTWEVQKKACEEICTNELSDCGLYYQRLIMDVTPGGQYATVVEGESSTTYGGLLDETAYTTDLKFSYKYEKLSTTAGYKLNVDYKDENGNPILVYYKGAWVSPNKIDEVEDFVKLFQPAWATVLVKFHPEYCKYMQCLDMQSSELYNQNMLKTNSYQDALDSGFLNPLGDGAVDFNINHNDPFWTGIGSGLSTNMQTKMNDYAQPWDMPCGRHVNIWELPYLTYICAVNADCDAGTDCLNTMDWDGPSCKPYQDLMWQMYRSLYIAAKAKVAMDLDNYNCGRYAAMDGKDTIFKTVDDATALLKGSSVFTMQSYSEAALYQECDSQCIWYADYWMQKLDSCYLDSLDKIALRAEFIAICQNGCSSESPMGATSVKNPSDKRVTSTYNSFKEAFDAYAAESKLIKKAGVCDINLIAYPNDYGHNTEPWEVDTAKCSRYTTAGDTCVNYGTDNSARKKAISKTLIKNDSTSCRRCVNCYKIKESIDSLFAYYGGFADTTLNTHLVVQNFINNRLNLNLSYTDYINFIRQCISDTITQDDSLLQVFENEYYQGIYDLAGTDILQSNFQNLANFSGQQNLEKNNLAWTSPNTKETSWPINRLFASANATPPPPPPAMPDPIRIQPCHCNRLADKWDNYIAGSGDPDDSAAFNDYVSNLCWEVSPMQPSYDFWALLKACKQAFDADDEHTTPPMLPGTNWSSTQENTLENLFYSSDSGLFYPACDTCGSASFGTDSSHNPFYSRHYNFRNPPPGGLRTGPGAPNTVTIPCDSFQLWLDSMMAPNGMHDFRTEMFQYAYKGTIVNPTFPLPPWSSIVADFYNRFPHASRDTSFKTNDQKTKDFFARYMHCLDGNFEYTIDGGCCYRLNEKAYRLYKLLQAYAGTRSGKPYNYFHYNGWSLYPDFDEYYNTSLYTKTCETTTMNKIASNKMPTLKFLIVDGACGDTAQLVLNYPQNYNNRAFFGRIVEINSFKLKATGNCDTTHYFQLTGKQKDNHGNLFDIVLNGWVNKYSLVDTCGRTYPDLLLCDKKQTELAPELDPCTKRLQMLALYQANRAYAAYADSIKACIRQAYMKHCRNAWHDETFTMQWKLQEYHFTLYYYDQAENLIQTIPPDGVHPLTSPTDLSAVKTARISHTSGTFPSHTFKTRYKFNTLNELVWQNTPDGGTSQFWYDNVGRLVVSRNAKQKPAHDYSYTKFDKLGRITQVGAMHTSDTITWAIAFDSADLEDFINAATRREVTRTKYDEAYATFSIPNFTQDNLRSRVASMVYEDIFDGNELTYDYGVHFTYDEHGVVPTMVRENQKLANTLYLHLRFKRIDYNYDLHSGKVNAVDYQSGNQDQYYQRYTYDADLRLVQAYSGNVRLALDLEAEYSYYLHGPLMRTEIGELKVQGVDYAYTIHGWIKGVNSGTLKSDRDIGRDGEAGSEHEMVAKDVYGYSLGFFREDFAAIGQASGSLTTSNFFMPEVGTSSGYHGATPDLWNGNIRQMVTAIKPFMTDSSQPQGMAYTYDQLNRIVSARAWNNVNVTDNKWRNGGSALGKYAENYTYDGNGNIQTLKRTAINGSGTTRTMDDFIYHYTGSTNQLGYVTDTVSAPAFTEDIDNQSSGNYKYDEIGNLIYDASEEIDTIKWNVYGKIQAVIRTAMSTRPDLEFEYDPMGQRTLKRVITKSEIPRIIETLYIRDANGNEMATYTLVNDSVMWNSASIYGSSRVGVYEENRLLEVDSTAIPYLPADEQLAWKGFRKYELSNHLGNVLVVISDKRTTVCDGEDAVQYYEADIVSAQDYYPFGMVMPGRSYANGAYRFGYCGYELENFGQDLINRTYSSKIGRFYSTDLLEILYPSLNPYNIALNCPIRILDYNGLNPGDLFTSLYDAAADFGLTYNDNSIAEDIEFGSTIYRIKYKGVYFYTYSKPNKGNSKTVRISNPLFHRGKVVSKIHTHSAYTHGINNKPSENDEDITTSLIQNPHRVPLWICTPSGYLYYIYPNHFEIETSLFIDKNTIPFDPASKSKSTALPYNSPLLNKNEPFVHKFKDKLFGPSVTKNDLKKSLRNYNNRKKAPNPRTLRNDL